MAGLSSSFAFVLLTAILASWSIGSRTNATTPGQTDVLSVNRPAYQISDYQSSTASRAVDGNYSTVSCTLTTTGPWWAVELYQQSHVGALIVTNDINPDRAWRLDNFFVWLSNIRPVVGQPLNPASSTLCRQYNGSVPAGGTAYITCPLVLPFFRYVIIQANVTSALCLTEVIIYRVPCDGEKDVLKRSGLFHRYRGAVLGSVVPVANATVVISPIECCALCLRIPCCKSVNFRRRRSSPDLANCVPLDRSVASVGFQQLTSAADWDWYYIDD